MNHLSVFQTIGIIWVILTSAFSTIAFFYLAYVCLRRFARQVVRGEVEENLDLQRTAESRWLERITK